MSHYLPFIFHLMKGEEIARKQDTAFLSIIWPNCSRLLSKLNKSAPELLCVHVGPCTWADTELWGFVHGKEAKQPPCNNFCWGALPGQHLCPMKWDIHRRGGLPPWPKLGSKVRNGDKKEAYPAQCWQSRSPQPSKPWRRSKLGALWPR